MTVSFEGIGENVVTFYNTAVAENVVEAGCPVKMSGNGEVAKAADGDAFIGVARAADGDFVAVQTAGYVKMPYSGVVPAVGYVHLASDGNGGVKAEDESTAVGLKYLVVDVETGAAAVGFIL